MLLSLQHAHDAFGVQTQQAFFTPVHGAEGDPKRPFLRIYCFWRLCQLAMTPQTEAHVCSALVLLLLHSSICLCLAPPLSAYAVCHAHLDSARAACLQSCLSFCCQGLIQDCTAVLVSCMQAKATSALYCEHRKHATHPHLEVEGQSAQCICHALVVPHLLQCLLMGTSIWSVACTSVEIISMQAKCNEVSTNTSPCTKGHSHCLQLHAWFCTNLVQLRMPC